jgi:hypothetical protein
LPLKLQLDATLLHPHREAMQVSLADLGQALAAGNVKARCVQWALNHAVFLKTLGQQGIGMRAHVFDGVHGLTQQKQTNLLALNLNAYREIGVQLGQGSDLVPVGVDVSASCHARPLGQSGNFVSLEKQ